MCDNKNKKETMCSEPIQINNDEEDISLDEMIINAVAREVQKKIGGIIIMLSFEEIMNTFKFLGLEQSEQNSK